MATELVPREVVNTVRNIVQLELRENSVISLNGYPI